VCRRNGDFCYAQTHVQPRAGGVSPPWLGNTRSATCDRQSSPAGVHSRNTRAGGRKPPVVIHHACAAAIVGTTSAVSSGETMQWIPYCTRTDLLNGFLHSRRHHAMDCGLWATCSPNLSTTCQTIPRIAGCRGSELPHRICPRSARPCD
jgi:hypothetical protein